MHILNCAAGDLFTRLSREFSRQRLFSSAAFCTVQLLTEPALSWKEWFNGISATVHGSMRRLSVGGVYVGDVFQPLPSSSRFFFWTPCTKLLILSAGAKTMPPWWRFQNFLVPLLSCSRGGNDPREIKESDIHGSSRFPSSHELKFHPEYRQRWRLNKDQFLRGHRTSTSRCS